jgi:subtilisin family serine protease
MKTGLILPILLLSIRFALGLGVARQEAEYRDYEILVKFRANVTEEQIASLEQDFGLARINRFDGTGVYHYWVPVDLTVPEAVELLSHHDWVDSAEPNFVRALHAYDNPQTNQWYLRNTGQSVNGATGPPGNDINWTAAISKFTTTNSVIVAVLDTGVALNHEDLTANIWTNTSERANGRDDDGNGYVDDLFGFDFVNNDPLPYDEAGHGSLVAGIIGAVADNGRGIVGICPRAKIMPLRVADQFGLIAISDSIPALEYARSKGAKIINCSFGGPGFSTLERTAYAALRDAGILVVCAAGNDGANNDQAPFYPASYNLANMISVAAVDRTLALASFSNYGTNSVQVAAPGTDMYSTDLTRIGVFRDRFQAGIAGWISGGVAGLYHWEFLTNGLNVYLSDGSWSSQNGDSEPYKPDTDTWMQSPRISLSTSIGCQLSFLADYDLADDVVRIETSEDLLHWTPIGYIFGSSIRGPISFDLSSADGRDVYLRFHLISNESWEGSGISVDDISITRISVFSDGQSARYTLDDGTSFAAPIVSGVAAMALAQRPDLTFAQVKSLILSNARPVAALAGKVASKGIVDAARVMTALGNLTIGGLAPVITANPQSQMVTVGATVSFSVSATGPAPLYYQWLFNGQPISAATDASYTIASVQLNQAGAYAAVVTNSFGSARSATAALVVDGVSAYAYAVIGVPFAYQVTANNNPTGFSASGLPPGFRCDNSGLISGIPTGTGIFRIRVEARNIFGSVSSTIIIAISEGAITSATSAEGVIGVPFLYQITANNNPSGYTASGLPPGFRCDPSGLILGTPTGAGTFPVHVEARNIFGSTSATVIFTISPGAITSATSAEGVVGVPFTYQITADNDPTGYSASGLPPGFRCDPSGLILGTPTGIGTFQVHVEAKNIFGSASATVVFIISRGTITSATSAEGIVGVPFAYQITADNEPTGYTASGLPPGFRCDPSGLILGTPTGAGTFPVHVEARNTFGSASANIVFTITDGTITSASSGDGVVGAPFAYQITADNNPTGYTASGLPPGFRCDPSGLILGTPTASGTFPVHVEAKNIFGSASATVVITITEGTISGGTTSQPALTISRTGDNVVLTWPATPDAFVLEETQLQQTTWTNSSANVVTQGNQNVVLIPVQSTAKFYRLRK